MKKSLCFSIIKLFCFHNNRKLCSKKQLKSVISELRSHRQPSLESDGDCMLGTKGRGFVLGTEATEKSQSQTWVRTAANTMDALRLWFWIKFCYLHFQKPDTIACLCIDLPNLQSSCNPHLLKLGYRTRDGGFLYSRESQQHHVDVKLEVSPPPTCPWRPSQAQSVCPQRPWEDTDPRDFSDLVLLHFHCLNRYSKWWTSFLCRFLGCPEIQYNS